MKYKIRIGSDDPKNLNLNTFSKSLLLRREL
jgi:hypothetical protein